MTSRKSYWKIISRVMNKCRAPKIPPLLINNMFILNCNEKVRLFNDFFSKQCSPITNSSVLPPLNIFSDKTIDHIHTVWRNCLINSKFKPQESNRFWWNTWSNATLCDNSVILTLKITFQNILVASSYPGIWKLANVTPVFKKKVTNS